MSTLPSAIACGVGLLAAQSFQVALEPSGFGAPLRVISFQRVGLVCLVSFSFLIIIIYHTISGLSRGFLQKVIHNVRMNLNWRGQPPKGAAPRGARYWRALLFASGRSPICEQAFTYLRASVHRCQGRHLSSSICVHVRPQARLKRSASKRGLSFLNLAAASVTKCSGGVPPMAAAKSAAVNSKSFFVVIL